MANPLCWFCQTIVCRMVLRSPAQKTVYQDARTQEQLKCQVCISESGPLFFLKAILQFHVITLIAKISLNSLSLVSWHYLVSSPKCQGSFGWFFYRWFLNSSRCINSSAMLGLHTNLPLLIFELQILIKQP